MLQKIELSNLPLTIAGMGRIDETRPIDLMEYALPSSKDAVHSYPVTLIPKTISVSKEIGRTVYDVTACFDTESHKSLLQQFQKLILESQN